MVNILSHPGVELETTYVMPRTSTREDLKREFPLAEEGAGFSYPVTFLEPTRETLEEMISIIEGVGLSFGGEAQRKVLEGFRDGSIPIDNLGVVNSRQFLDDGKELYWYFVKSPKDERGKEFTVRSGYPTPRQARYLHWETLALFQRSEVLYGLVRDFSRLRLRGEKEGEEATIDLRHDHCGSISPHLGMNVHLKTLEVEIDPSLEAASIEAFVARVHEKVRALGGIQTSIRMPHLSRDRRAAESLKRFLQEAGANEEDYVQLYPGP